MVRQINEYPNYSISDCGIVTNTKTGKILKNSYSKDGYKTVVLYNEKGCKRFQIHRLVAEMFISNPEVKPQVNHIDGNKENNCVDNLEWCSVKHNQWHRRKVLGKENDRKVMCVESQEVFESIKDAAIAVGSYIPNIVRACKNGSTACGKHWKYIIEKQVTSNV